MRYKVALFLIVFVSFLSMPTIVSLIEKKSDISVLLSVDDEEVEKEALDLYVTSEFQYFYDVLSFFRWSAMIQLPKFILDI